MSSTLNPDEEPQHAVKQTAGTTGYSVRVVRVIRPIAAATSLARSGTNSISTRNWTITRSRRAMPNSVATPIAPAPANAPRRMVIRR